MNTDWKKVAVVLVAAVVSPLVAFAQDPPSNVRMRIGPLYINPTLSLTNAGKDTNVFNDSKDPQEDFTVTVSPGTDLWLRVGPTSVQGNIKEDIVWFQKFASERSANNSYSLSWSVPLNRLNLRPTWSYTNSRDRPGYEIDARAEHTNVVYGASIDYRLFTKTSIGVDGRRASTNFAEGTTFQGTDLHTELSPVTTSAAVNIKHQLTPLTSLTVAGSLSQDRFKLDPARDTDSMAVTMSMRFDPAALLKGNVNIGYRDFKPASPDLPGFKGSTMAVDLAYTLLGMSKFAFNANRDVQYSYDINQPYYVQTTLGGSVSQQIFGPVDVVVRGATGRLEYRDRAGAVVAAANRVDRIQQYGGGLGYHLGRDMRVGVNADYSTRLSALDTRHYQGWTYGVAITYATGAGGS